MKTKVLIALCCVGLSFTSCSTKTSAINDLRSLQERIEKKGENYTVEDWKEAKEKFEKINAQIEKNKDKYTAEEYEEIGRLEGLCLSSFAKSVIGNVKNKVTNAASAIKGLIDGIKEINK